MVGHRGKMGRSPRSKVRENSSFRSYKVSRSDIEGGSLVIMMLSLSALARLGFAVFEPEKSVEGEGPSALPPRAIQDFRGRAEGSAISGDRALAPSDPHSARGSASS